MEIEGTNRNLQKLAFLNNNLRAATKVRSLEQAVRKGRGTYPLHLLYKAIGDYGIEHVPRLSVKDYYAYAAFPEVLYVDERYDNYVNTLEQCPGTSCVSYPSGRLEVIKDVDLDFNFQGRSLTYVLCAFPFKEATDGTHTAGLYEFLTSIDNLEGIHGNVLLIGDPLLLGSYLLGVEKRDVHITVLRDAKSCGTYMHLSSMLNLKTEIVCCDDCVDYIRKRGEGYDFIFFNNYVSPQQGYDTYVHAVSHLPSLIFNRCRFWLHNSILLIIRANILQYLSAKLTGDEQVRAFSDVGSDVFRIFENDTLRIERPEQICLPFNEWYIERMFRSFYS